MMPADLSKWYLLEIEHLVLETQSKPTRYGPDATRYSFEMEIDSYAK